MNYCFWESNDAAIKYLNCVKSVWVRENTDQNNSEYGHFLRSVTFIVENKILVKILLGLTKKTYKIPIKYHEKQYSNASNALTLKY